MKQHTGLLDRIINGETVEYNGQQLDTSKEFIMVAPQCASDKQWVDTPWGKKPDPSYNLDEIPQSQYMTAVVELIDKMKASYNLNSARMYISGLSMGGFGTWDLITRYPDLFAAAIPMGGAGDSYWARGQGWAISGFAMAYRFTDDKSFLDTSIGLAKKLFELNEENYIPRWDMVFKGRRNVPRDTSAASIIANGLMEIYDATGIDEYKEYAYNILVELYKNYSTRYEDKTEGIITEATGHMPRGINVNVSLVYGDYYFVELLCRILGVCKGYW